MVDILGYRMNDKWLLEVGDLVKCKPLSGNKFLAEVTKIRTGEDGKVIEVEVIGGGKTRSVRTFLPGRISRP